MADQAPEQTPAEQNGEAQAEAGQTAQATEGQEQSSAGQEAVTSDQAEAAVDQPAEGEQAKDEEQAQQEQEEASGEGEQQQQDEQQQQQQEGEQQQQEGEQQAAEPAQEEETPAAEQAADGEVEESPKEDVDQQQAEVAEPEVNAQQEEVVQSQEDGKDEAPNGDVAAELSEEDRAYFKRLFDKKGVDGRVDLKTFKLMFRLRGEVLTAEKAEEMFNCADTDENKMVDFEEFCRMYAKYSEPEQNRKNTMMSCVNKLFKDDEKEVDLKKVTSMLNYLHREMGKNQRLQRELSDLSEGSMETMVRRMDKDGNGKISKEELVNMLASGVDL